MSIRRFAARSACLGAVLLLLASCGSTLDSIGCNERNHGFDGGNGLDGSISLATLSGPAAYPNAFRDLLGKSDSDITAKIASTFDQLFHGNTSTEAIFVPTGTDQAYILDVLHNEIRTEGIGLGMIISVELDKRDEFDRLWRYAKSIQVQAGPAQGYFPSYCAGATADSASLSCYDPYGLQQIATALLLARGRWQAAPGTIDYGQEASSLLDLIRNKGTYNCGVVDSLTAPFDSKSKLPYDMPTTASANVSRPSIVMPAYYDLWHQATGDTFWLQAADAARAYWRAAAHPTTGLVPQRAAFDGTPVPGSETFMSECDRTFFNMAIDRVWSGGQPWLIDESNRVLRFFSGEGIATYGQSYSLDGTNEIASLHDMALIVANGTLALIATNDDRSAFVDAVWNLTTPTGQARYYTGIQLLWSLMILGGQMRVY
jgi:oligosaccharide reducing-end xylanase